MAVIQRLASKPVNIHTKSSWNALLVDSKGLRRGDVFTRLLSHMHTKHNAYSHIHTIASRTCSEACSILQRHNKIVTMIHTGTN